MTDICPICEKPVDHVEGDGENFFAPAWVGLPENSKGGESGGYTYVHTGCLVDSIVWIGQMMRRIRITPGKLTIASEGDLSITAGPVKKVEP